MPTALRALGGLLVLLIATVGCTTTTPTPIAVEEQVSEAISGAKHVAYWLDVDLSTVHNPDAPTQEEMSRLKASAARLSAQAEALEEQLERATRDRAAGHSSDFHATGMREARLLREQTAQVRTQWESFLKSRDAQDAAERPGGAARGLAPAT